MPEPHIWIDNREPLHSIRYPLLDKIKGSEEMQLGTGDFMIADACEHFAVIERKAIKDLLNSLGSDRFRDQMQRVTTFDHPFLIIEGQWSVLDNGHIAVPDRSGWRDLKWSAATVQMNLVSWQGNHPGLTVLHTSSHEETVSTIIALWNRGKGGCVMTGIKNTRC